MTSQPRLGLLFILVGPSGVGKNTLMKTALGQLSNLKQLPTVTTRPRRPSEVAGREHLFVSRAEFQQMVDSNALIERQGQEVHGELYGMPKAAVEGAIAKVQDLIADIDVFGATLLHSIYPDNTVLIFIQPEFTEDLIVQMEERGETEAEINKRMRRVEMEMHYAPLCDYLITNEKGKAAQASENLRAIILAERCRRALLNLRVEQDLPRHKFTYVSSVVPIFGNEILFAPKLPHFPTAQLTNGEFPHEAALRALQQDLQTTALPEHLYRPLDASNLQSTDELILPLSLGNDVKEHHQEIVFFYLYRLTTRLKPPAGWSWTGYQHVQLPKGILRAIRALLGEIPAPENGECSHEPA